MIHGAFLRKVICLALLVPFSLTLALNYLPIGEKNGKEATEPTASVAQQNSPLVGQEETEDNIFWTVFIHFIDPGLQLEAQKGSGRNWAAIIAIFGIFLLNGLLVTSFIDAINKRKEEWQNGEIRYKKRQLGDFAIVIGANEIVATVIQRLLTEVVPGSINNKCEKNNDYVVLQTSRDPKKVRTELASRLTEEQLKKVIIYNALRDSKDELKHLYPMHCTEIYVLGESTLADGGQPVDGGESFHDALNMRCVNIIAEIISEEKDRTGCTSSSRRICKVLFEYQTTYSIFQFSDVSDDIKKSLVFIPINRYESWARKVIVDNFSDGNRENSDIRYTPLDGYGITAPKPAIIDEKPLEIPDKEIPDDHVHLVVIGMSKMGVAMGLQAMLQCHYVNYAASRPENRSKRRTRITFIDTNADKEMDFFKGRYENLFQLACYRYFDAENFDCTKPSVIPGTKWVDPMVSGDWNHLSQDGANFIDIEIEFIKGDIESKGIRNYLRYISDDKYDPRVKSSKLTVAICLTKTHQAVAASLYMPIEVYKKAQEVWVYQRESADIIQNLTLQNQKDERYSKLKAFGMLYSDYLPDRTLYLKSLLVNGAYDFGDPQKPDNLSVNPDKLDMADKTTYKLIRETWSELSLDKTFSNKYFVDTINQKLRSLNIKENEIKSRDGEAFNDLNLHIAEHNRWNIQQLLFGYSPCSPEEDAELARLDGNRRSDKGKESRNEWRKNVNWSNLTPLQKTRTKKSDEGYLKTEHGIYDMYKNALKEGKERKHPNICDYEHLSIVDSEAKDYDETLNKIIPMIIMKVNLHPSLKAKQ